MDANIAFINFVESLQELHDDPDDANRQKVIEQMEELTDHLRDGGNAPNVDQVLSNMGYNYDGVHIYS